MIKRISLLAILICAMLPMTSCGSDDDPIEEDKLQSVDITYTFTVTEDLLEYFNITAEYLNVDGAKVGKQMNGPTLTVTTSAKKFPAERPITFSVTRTEKAAPTETPKWTKSISIVAVKHYYPSGNEETAIKTDSNGLTPRPDSFDTWANSFIKTMDTGYAVTIKSDGSVSF